jgi:hypothetical protein
METQDKNRSAAAERRVVLLIHSAIAGASIAAALELASRETHPPLLLFSLGSFAIAIPAALALVVLSQVIYELGKQYLSDGGAETQSWPALAVVLAVVDQVACFLGFLGIFWYFHWVIGMIFLAATIVAFLTLWTAEKRLQKQARQSAAQTAEVIPE